VVETGFEPPNDQGHQKATHRLVETITNLTRIRPPSPYSIFLTGYWWAMSQADIETLRTEYEALSRMEWDAVLREAHADFELKPPDRSAVPETVHGREEARRAFEDFFEPFEEVLIEPQEFFECGDQIVVYFLQRSRPKGSSAVVEIRAGHRWTMRDGRAARCEIFPEREEALEAARLRE
jgi:ketosteroid isomerase-like protein